MFVVVFLVGGGGGWYFFVPCRKFRSPYLGKAQQPQEQRYPFLSVCAVFLCVQTMVWLPMFGIFNTHTDVPACNCTQGLYGHRKRVCTESWLWEKNPLLHRGLEPASRLRLAFQSNALPTELSQPQLLCTVTLMGREGVGGGEACKVHKGKFWKSNPIKQMYKSVA